MKEVNISIQGMDLDYKTAHRVANSVAGLFNQEPALIAWHDEPHQKMSPAIAGADIHSRWHDYGESYGGTVNISINGDYDFIYGDSAQFEGLEEPHPYIQVRDRQGNEYFCLPSSLKDPDNPKEDACYKLDETGAYG